jgi:hypothetical protein
MLHFNLKYLCCALVCVPVGLASREWAYLLPSFPALYAGDTIWAMLVYFLMRSVIADLKTSFIAALVFSFAIEFLQLYHASWIEAIRNTKIGGLILGFGFLWSDLLCYSVGILLAALIDHLLLRSDKNK